MALVRHPLEVAVRDWLLRVWAGRNVEVVYSPLSATNTGAPPRPFASVRFLSPVRLGAASGERVYRDNADNPEILDVDLRTFSEGSLSLQVFADDASELVLRLRASLSSPAELVASSAAGLQVLDLGPEIDTSFEEGGEWVRRVTLDVVCGYASHFTTTVPALASVVLTDELHED